MRLFSILFVCLSFASFKTHAQTAKNTIFLELGGPSLLGAVNYDLRLPKLAKGLGVRAGIGGFKIDGEGLTYVPVGVNYLLTKDNKNHFELGTGITFLSVNDADLFDSNSNTFGHLNFGYRFQQEKGGFVFRAAITPIFGKGFFWSYYGGISLGYAF